MRYTLLEAVQLILSALDSDEVDSYDDTVESLQVANILRSTYYDMATEIGLEEHETLFQLTASGDNNLPCLMTVPTNVVNVREIRYNTEATGEYVDYDKIEYVPFAEFLDLVESYRTATSGVAEQSVTVNGQTYKIMCGTTAHPKYWSSPDEYNILFNSHYSTDDTTLQASKTMCFGTVYPTFTLANATAPDLDPTQFSLWINKAKTRAFKELKQQDNNESAMETRKQKIIVQKKKRNVGLEPELQRITRFGRK